MTKIHTCKIMKMFLYLLVLLCFSGPFCEGGELKARIDLQNYKVPPDTGDGWKTTGISNVGLNAKLLLDMVDRIRNNVYPNIHSVLIVKDDKLVMEEYFSGKNRLNRYIPYDKDSLHELHSVTKSWVKEATKDNISHLSTNFMYGYQWWSRTLWVWNQNFNIVNAEGRGGQFIISGKIKRDKVASG